MSRYVQAEVDDAIAQVERGVYTPHAQIVLAAEVRELREQYETVCGLLRSTTIVCATHLATIARVEALAADLEARDQGDMFPREAAAELRDVLPAKPLPSAAEPVP